MKTFKGIDISNHNGNVNFKKVKKDGIKFVMIRAGYGWYNQDVKFEEYVRKCGKENIDYGIYLYTYATNLSQAKEEVKYFLNHIKGKNPTYPIVVDCEDADLWRKRNGNPSWKTLADMLFYQLSKIEEAGYYAMYYASKHWYDNLVKANPRLKEFDLWLAHWGIDKPSVDCGIWQYSSKGKVNGINSYTDMNIAYKDYPTIIKGAGLNGFKKIEKPKSDPKPPSIFKNVGDKKNIYIYEKDGKRQKGFVEYKDKKYYFRENGTLVYGGFYEIDGATYYFKPYTGEMVTGWKRIKNKIYYFRPTGSMVTLWQKIDGKWHFFTEKGTYAFTAKNLKKQDLKELKED